MPTRLYTWAMKIITPEQLPQFVLDKRGKKTQEEFAAEFGVTKQAVVQWEKGQTMPKADVLEKLGLAKCYRVI
jgi:ribosome-binding protein aMBF1 (putative translation factor)